MTPGSSGNKGASVRQRLLNQARASKVDYNQLLIRYAIERFLYRLSISPHRNAFVLKGAMLFTVWQGTPHRATRDLDLLGFGERSDQRLIDVFRNICETQAPEDGLAFDPESVTVQAIRAEDEYGGLRINLVGDLAGARLALQVDIGFGDAISPGAIEAAYPRLLDEMPEPHLRMYPRETVIAEKLEAIVSLGMLNTRFKDYYDLHFLAQNFAFDGGQLATAIRNTFTRRGTSIPKDLPTGLTAAFANDMTKLTQWKAFLRRINSDESPLGLPAVVETISAFAWPSVEAAANLNKPFTKTWPVRGPWKES